MLSLSSTEAVTRGLVRAKEIAAQAYTLHGRVLRALEAAARHGAHVVVELERKPFDNPHLARENQRIVNELRDAGVDARLSDPIHAKVIGEDGTLYLDDKNFGTHDLILRADSDADLRSVPMVKHEALAAEAQLLRNAQGGDDVIVESESFGAYNAVYSALDSVARSGLSPRLLVCERELRGNARERELLRGLALDGVRVRVCKNSEKLAVAGKAGWIGSANATIAAGPTDLPDWGLATKNSAIVHAVRDRIESVWVSAKDFRPY